MIDLTGQSIPMDAEIAEQFHVTPLGAAVSDGQPRPAKVTILVYYYGSLRKPRSSRTGESQLSGRGD